MDLRTDPLSGRLVAVAPNRRRRPGAAFGQIGEATPEELAECPFCAGREERTPPETFRVTAGGGWLVRVVPNLYPAFERQEVVVHSPRHVRTFADLSDAEVAATAAAWVDRKRAAREEGFAYVHALVNEGVAAGASRAHSHSQLVWLHQRPPALAVERPEAVAELLARDDLTVVRRDGLAAVVHPAGRLPYETLVASESGELDLAAALVLLRELVRRLRTVEGPVPWNAWLHDGETPHLELVPRLSILAGVELGAGIHVNAVAPEDAATALRTAGD